jgi:signal transduction histidine kinase
MKRGPIIAAGAILILPTIFSLWMGWRALDADRAGARQSVRRVFEARLGDLATKIDDFVKSMENELLNATENLYLNDTSLREFSRESGVIRQAFYIKDGQVQFPPRFDGRQSETEFFQRAKDLLESELDKEVGPDSARYRPDSGWATWFYGDGQQFAFWRKTKLGGILGLELNAAALMGRLAGIMPEALPADSLASKKTENGQLFVLFDARGKDFMTWGGYVRSPGERPLASIQLEGPFKGWELECFASSGAQKGAANAEYWFLILASLLLAIVIGGATFLLTRSFKRELEEAGQRVSFVNQVSHELKTPLTNIRLYVDLFRQSMKKIDARQEGYLDVISSESERLTRLIHNVLSFARRDKAMKPRPESVDWDELVSESLNCFKPAFREKGIELTFKPGGSGRAGIDADWARQIIGNLVSNAEKYAAAGKSVEVSSGAEDGMVWARVRDRGPGIQAKDAQRIFEPFTRLSDSITEGVSGSGLGLSIARDLARAHGGDLTLENGHDGSEGRSALGADFLLKLRDIGRKA